MGELVRIDPSSGAVQATVKGVGDYGQKPFEGAGLIWVPSSDSLVGIDPQTNQVVHTFPGAYSADGAYAQNHLWVGNGNDGLLEIDPATGATLATVSPPTTQEEGCLNTVAFIDGAIWWSVNDQGLIERVDPQTATITATIDGAGYSFLAGASNGIWVVSTDGTVKKIDEASNTLGGSISWGEPERAVCAGGMVADGTTLWLIDNGHSTNTIFSVDTDSTATAPHDTGGFNIQDLAQVDGSLWTDFFDSGLAVKLKPFTS